MFFRHSRKRGDLSTAARIRVEIIHGLKVLLAAIVLSIVIIVWVVSSMPGPVHLLIAPPTPMKVSAYIYEYNLHWGHDLCTAYNHPISCVQATATAQANPRATDDSMCCVH